MAFEGEYMGNENVTVDEVMDKLREDPDFQNAMKKFEEADTLSRDYSLEMTDKLVDMLHLQDTNQTIENARFNLLVAKMSAAKLLASLASFSYEEKDFMDAVDRSRHCIQEEIVPLLTGAEPCGECENCKNGRPDICLRPNIRREYIESRFLPILAESLIEYDAWNEILFNSIPQDKRDVDVLKDINDDFQNQANEIVHKRKGRPSKTDKFEEE